MSGGCIKGKNVSYKRHNGASKFTGYSSWTSPYFGGSPQNRVFEVVLKLTLFGEVIT